MNEYNKELNNIQIDFSKLKISPPKPIFEEQNRHYKDINLKDFISILKDNLLNTFEINISEDLIKKLNLIFFNLMKCIYENILSSESNIEQKVLDTSNIENHNILYSIDSNVTTNRIYFINKKLVVKLRYEIPLINYDKELELRKNISVLNLAPKLLYQTQLLHSNFSIIICIEEMLKNPFYLIRNMLKEESLELVVKKLSIYNACDFILSKRGRDKNNMLDFYIIFNNKMVLEAKYNINLHLNNEKINNNYLIDKNLFNNFIKDLDIAYQEYNKLLNDESNVFYNVLFLSHIDTNYNNMFTNIYSYLNDDDKSFINNFSLNDINNFEKEATLKFIDFEYMSYTLLGWDVISYLIDASYDLLKEYPFFIPLGNNIEKDKKKLLYIMTKYKNYLNMRLSSIDIKDNILKSKIELIIKTNIDIVYIYKLLKMNLIKLIIDYINMTSENQNYIYISKWLIERYNFVNYKLKLYNN